MKHTELLRIIMDRRFSPLEIAIHPNDGQDLDLYTRENILEVFAGKSIDTFKKGEGQLGNGELHLLNECTLGTLIISNSLSEKLNFSDSAIIIRDQNKIFLTFS